MQDKKARRAVKNHINALVLEAVKGNDHFLLVYPNTNVGHMKAKEAVMTWLLNRELGFNRHDAEQLWSEIDARRFSGAFDSHGEARVQCDLPIPRILCDFPSLIEVLTSNEEPRERSIRIERLLVTPCAGEASTDQAISELMGTGRSWEQPGHLRRGNLHLALRMLWAAPRSLLGLLIGVLGLLGGGDVQRKAGYARPGRTAS